MCVRVYQKGHCLKAYMYEAACFMHTNMCIYNPKRQKQKQTNACNGHPHSFLKNHNVWACKIQTCMHLYINVFIYIYTYVCLSIYTFHACTHTHTNKTHTHRHACACTGTMHRYGYMHNIYTHSCTQTHAQTPALEHIHGEQIWIYR